MTVSMSVSVPDRSVAASLFESQLRRQLEVLAEAEGPLLHQPVVGVQQADAGSHLRLRGGGYVTPEFYHTTDKISEGGPSRY